MVLELERVLVELVLRLRHEYLRGAEDEGVEERHRHAPVILHAGTAEDTLRARLDRHRLLLERLLNNAIDWVSRMKEQPFKEKPVAIQSCSQGILGGARMQYHWRMSMTFLNAFIFGTPEVFVAQAQNKFDKDTLELKDHPTKDVIKMQIAAFAKFIAKMKKW